MPRRLPSRLLLAGLCSAAASLALAQERTARQPAPPLAGLDEAAVRAKLGEPALARAEGAGALWTYRLPRCALFVYFTDEGGGLRVAGADAGPRRFGDPSPDIGDCLAQASPEQEAARMGQASSTATASGRPTPP